MYPAADGHLAGIGRAARGRPRRPGRASACGPGPKSASSRGSSICTRTARATATRRPRRWSRWYAAHGYDFIVFTDHNRITAPPSTPSMLVVPGVELTQNSDRCTPAPPPGRKCLLHVNALFVTPPALGLIPWGLPASSSRVAIYGRAIAAARRMGGLAQLNHPNFHYGADGPLVAALAREGLTLLEIANQSWDSNDTPDGKGHPTSEAIWDAALTAGATVYGTATDDAHHYFDARAAAARGESVFPGDLGFVMVRARKDPAAIRDALAHGDFYASTGVLLARVEHDARGAHRRGRRALARQPPLRLHRRGRQDLRDDRAAAPRASRSPARAAATCAPSSPIAPATRPGRNRSASRRPETAARAAAPRSSAFVIVVDDHVGGADSGGRGEAAGAAGGLQHHLHARRAVLRRRGAPGRRPLRDGDCAHHAGRLRLPVVQGARRRRAGGRRRAICRSAATASSATIRWSSRTRCATRASPTTRSSPGTRASASTPASRWRSNQGSAVGALSVADRSPRTLTERQLESLRRLAKQIARELRLRRDLEKAGAATPLPDTLIAPGACVGGRWRIGRELGRGAVGVVHEAHDPDGQRAAVKFLLPEWRAQEEVLERFAREARVLMRLDTPHVGRLLDVGNLDAGAGGVPYLVLEYLEGKDLGEVIRESGRVPIRAGRSAGAPTPATGSPQAHEVGVVHRDIKPSNVFLADTGGPRGGGQGPRLRPGRRRSVAGERHQADRRVRDRLAGLHGARADGRLEQRRRAQRHLVDGRRPLRASVRTASRSRATRRSRCSPPS